MANEEDVPILSQTQPGPGRLARPDPVALGPDTVLAGRYDIGPTLGRGGTGVVMRAYDRVLREEVAIKVLRPEYAAERRWVQRLAREVKLARARSGTPTSAVFTTSSRRTVTRSWSWSSRGGGRCVPSWTVAP